VLSGFVRVTVGRETFDLGPGDRLDLPAGTLHAIEVVGLSPVVYVTGTTDKSLRSSPARLPMTMRTATPQSRVRTVTWMSTRAYSANPIRTSLASARSATISLAMHPMSSRFL